MAENTVLKHFQIFRNTPVVSATSHAAAVTDAKDKFATLTGLKDGELVLYRYELNDETTIHTLVGVHYISSEGTGSTYEILGNYDQLSAEYKAYVNSVINALDVTVTDSNEKNDITVKVTQTDGKLTAVEVTDNLADVAHTGAAANVSIADGSKLFTAENVEGALTEVMTKANALQAAQLTAGTGIDIEGTTINADLKLSIAKEGDVTYLYIKDNEGAEISKVDAAAFVKDGFLQSVELDEENGELVFTWNTDAESAGEQNQVTKIAISDLCDVYTAKQNDWIQLKGFEFSHKTQSAFTQVEGQDAPQTTFGANAADVTVENTTSQSFKVPTLTVDAAGHVTAASEKTVTITLPKSIDSAVQSVTKPETEKYLKIEKSVNDVTIATKTQTMEGAAAEGAEDGLATALDVKAYVDEQVGDATTAITEAIGKLDADVTGTSAAESETGAFVTVNVVEENGVITGVTVTDNIDEIIASEIAKLDVDVTNIETLEGAKTTNDIKVSISEVDGKLTSVTVTDTLKQVAHSGAAADVAVADAEGVITATTVEGALTEIAKEIDAMDSSLATTDDTQKDKLVKLGYTQEDGVITSLTSDETALENRLQGLQNATTLEGVDAIDVSYGETNTVSLKLAEETILTQGEGGLKATLSIVYNSDDKQIELHGVNGVIGEPIDATAFIKDGMLEDAEIITATDEEGLVAGKRYIKFTFKTYQQGQEGVEELLKVEYLDVENLFDSYTSGNEWIVIDQTTNEISHKELFENEQQKGSVTTAEAAVANEHVEFAVPTIKIDEAGHIIAISDNTVKVTLPASIATAVQVVNGESKTDLNNTDFVNVKTTRTDNDITLTSSVKTQAVAGAKAAEGDSPSVDGLATALDVKTYVDEQVGDATTAITEAIGKLDADVTNIETLEGAKTTNDIKVSISEVDGKLTSVTVVDKLATVAHSGAAADITITDTNNKFTATTVEDALLELVSVDTWDAGTY